MSWQGDDVDLAGYVFHAPTRIETAATISDGSTRVSFAPLPTRACAQKTDRASYFCSGAAYARHRTGTAGSNAELAVLDGYSRRPGGARLCAGGTRRARGGEISPSGLRGGTGIGVSAGPGCGRGVRGGVDVRRPATAPRRVDARAVRASSRSATRCPASRAGRAAGSTPDRFLVGLATLGLLSDVAEERPLVCLINDAQWLDRASTQVLSFVARRLAAERIAMVFAIRTPSEEQELDGLPNLVVEGLGDHDARQLLASAVPGRLDEQVRDRIVAETRGNPLALLELPRSLTPAEMAGGFGLPGAQTLSGRIEQGFLRRIESLPEKTRELLFVAAAEPVGDVTLLLRALDKLGISADAVVPAENAGLIELGSRVRFRHPLVRSAAYRAAAPEARRRGHAALGRRDRPADRARSAGLAPRIRHPRS